MCFECCLMNTLLDSLNVVRTVDERPVVLNLALMLFGKIGQFDFQTLDRIQSRLKGNGLHFISFLLCISAQLYSQQMKTAQLVSRVSCQAKYLDALSLLAARVGCALCVM